MRKRCRGCRLATAVQIRSELAVSLGRNESRWLSGGKAALKRPQSRRFANAGRPDVVNQWVFVCRVGELEPTHVGCYKLWDMKVIGELDSLCPTGRGRMGTKMNEEGRMKNAEVAAGSRAVSCGQRPCKVVAYGLQTCAPGGHGRPVVAEKHEICETNPNFRYSQEVINVKLNCVFDGKKRTQMNPNKANLNPL